jgi:hypothetical protein
VKYGKRKQQPRQVVPLACRIPLSRWTDPDAARSASFSTIEQQAGLQLLDGLEQAAEKPKGSKVEPGNWNMYRLKSLRVNRKKETDRGP